MCGSLLSGLSNCTVFVFALFVFVFATCFCLCLVYSILWRKTQLICVGTHLVGFAPCIYLCFCYVFVLYLYCVLHPPNQKPPEPIDVSTLIWLFAHRLSRFSNCRVSALWCTPPIDCNTWEQSLKALTGHILQRFKGSPVHILKLMRGREVAARSSIQHFKWGETIQLSLTLGGKLTVFSWHNKYKTLQIKKNSSTFKSKAMENFTKNTKKLSFRLRRKLLTVGQINV